MPREAIEFFKSRPARGAWVEMTREIQKSKKKKSRPARGAWVEIFVATSDEEAIESRAPQGARGLKYLDDYLDG